MYLIGFLFLITVVNYCRSCVPTFIAATGPTITTSSNAFIPTTPTCAPSGCMISDLVDFTTTITGPNIDSACVTTINVMCNVGFTMVRVRSGATIIFVGSPISLTCNEVTDNFSYEFTPGTFMDVNSAFCV